MVGWLGLLGQLSSQLLEMLLFGWFSSKMWGLECTLGLLGHLSPQPLECLALVCLARPVSPHFGLGLEILLLFVQLGLWLGFCCLLLGQIGSWGLWGLWCTFGLLGHLSPQLLEC